MGHNIAESHESKFYASNKPIKEETICMDIDDNKRVVKFIELIAAPEDYLIKNNYTPCRI